MDLLFRILDAAEASRALPAEGLSREPREGLNQDRLVVGRFNRVHRTARIGRVFVHQQIYA